MNSERPPDGCPVVILETVPAATQTRNAFLSLFSFFQSVIKRRVSDRIT